MEASNNQPPPPSKQQQQLYVANGSAWLPKGPMCFACLISLLFAVLALITFFLVPIFSDDGTGHDGADEVILVGSVISLCYLISLVTGVIGRRRVKRDPDLKGNKFNTLYLKLLTIVNLGNTSFVLFIWAYVLPGELNGGCC